jgi:hypothetical protein
VIIGQEQYTLDIGDNLRSWLVTASVVIGFVIAFFISHRTRRTQLQNEFELRDKELRTRKTDEVVRNDGVRAVIVSRRDDSGHVDASKINVP